MKAQLKRCSIPRFNILPSNFS